MSKKPESQNDDEVWQRVAEGVTPLRRARPRAMEAPPPPKPMPAPRKIAAPPSPMPPPPPLPAVTVTPADSPSAPRIDRRSVRRLKRGDVTIEARIDLHGSTQAEAHRRLGRFIHECHAEGLRLVLVITGKGLRPDGGIGVLRESVPRWLGEAATRRLILGLSPAAAKDGGDGALYVRLKRRA